VQSPRIEQQPSQWLVGMSLEMSRTEDRTGELWGSFMPRRHEVLQRLNTDFWSMQVFPGGPEQLYDPGAQFTKWAAVAVVDNDTPIPAQMQAYELTGGLYAVFMHTGPATDSSTFEYIFSQWLPNSSYTLDDREHFEVLPEHYRPMDPLAQEEIWIPVRPS